MSDRSDSRSSSPVPAVEVKSDSPASLGSPREEERVSGRKRPRIQDPDEEDEDEDEAGVDAKEEGETKNGGGQGDDEDEDEDEDEEEDEDDDEDEEEEDVQADGERKKKRRRKSKKYRFLDVEAEVDDEDEEDDEADDYGDVADFIDEQPADGAIERDDTAHRRLDRAFGRENQQSAEEIVRGLKERHGKSAAARYNADSDSVPQRLLMPGVNDPSLWTVRVKPGREQNIIASVFRRVFTQQYTDNPIDVTSIFYRESLPGMIFVEARQSAAVNAALLGLVGVFYSRGVNLVPIEEMAPLLKMKKQDTNLVPNMWVRMKRGKYAGDLAQILDVDQITSGVVGVKFIPRIDLTPKEKKRANGRAGGSNVRAPQRLFNYDDVRKIYGRSAVRQGGNGGYFFENDEYIDGFCVKDVKMNTVSAEDVKPTLEEVSRFSGDDNNTAKFDLSAIADANKNLSVSVLFPGDKVEVYEGEQTGLYGLVITVTPDVIAVKAEGGELHGQTIEVPAKSVRKRFEVGEHVKVLSGKNTGASGMVVEVKGDVVTLMSDQGEQEIKAFSKDIRKASDLAQSSMQTGLYDKHDMIMLDSSTSGVIVKIEGALLRILDQNGGVRVLSPSQVTPRRENKNFAVATDSQGSDMRVGDQMKEIEGEQRKGEVINIFRSLFVFLYNRDLSENNGVFVARAQGLTFVTPKSASGNDLTKLNPALQAQLPYGGASLMAPPAVNPNKNRLVNTLVVVVKGTNKGLMGVIKDVLGQNARVELATNNKTLTISLAMLKRKDPKTGATMPLETGAVGSYGGSRPPAGGYDVNPYGASPMGGAPMGGATPYAAGGKTPGGRFGQTPNPYAGGFGGGKTPNPYAMAGAGGRTPAPGWSGSGGKTPAAGWAGGGGKTPGYGGGGGRTPAPGYGDGGKTPGWGGAGMGGGKTPNPYANVGAAGGRTPAPQYSEGGPSRFNAPISAPTPYGGPPPISAPTPAAPSNPYSAPTPYGAPTPFTAPTPFAAPTPGAALSAPTPGGFGNGPTPFGAPTPYGSAPTPYGAPAGPGAAGIDGIPFDWALDFRNVIVEVGPSTRSGTRNPLHFQRGAYDGQRFGIDELKGEDTAHCVLLDDTSIVEEIPAEYLRPCKPDGPGQMVIIIAGGDGVKGQQKTTSYLNDGQWMMEMDGGGMGAMVIPEEHLCRIWKI